MIERFSPALPANGNGHLPAQLPDDSVRLLAVLDNACAALAGATDPGEVRDLRDLGETARHFAQQRGLGIEAQNRAMGLRLEAERWLGDYLLRTERNAGGRPGENPSLLRRGFPTLEELGLSCNDALRCRRLAAVPGEAFAGWLAECQAESDRLTVSAAESLARRFWQAGFEVGQRAREAANSLLARYQAATGNPDADARDLFQTPAWALDCVLEYLPRHWRIWECATGNGNLEKRLRDLGFAVAGTDILTGVDFLSCEAPECDLILTNPPYAYKDDFLARCFEIGRPFLLLLPVTAIAEQGRIAMYSRWGIDLVLPPRRINFETPGGLTEETGSSAWKFTGWFTWHLPIPDEHFGGRVVFPREDPGQ